MAVAFLTVKEEDDASVFRALELGRCSVSDGDNAGVFSDTFNAHDRVYLFLKGAEDYRAVALMTSAPDSENFFSVAVITKGRRFPLEQKYSSGEAMAERDVANAVKALWGPTPTTMATLLRGRFLDAAKDFSVLRKDDEA